MRVHKTSFAGLALVVSLTGCPGDAGKTPNPTPPGAPPAPAGNTKAAELATWAKTTFGVLPAEAEDATGKHEVTPDKVALGRMLYFEERLSRGQKISCNTCHKLDKFGVDNEPTSPGHKDQRGERNSPTVYNSALQFRQFWDSRSKDVEDQATKPITNQIEMAMLDETKVVEILKSIPGYEAPFKAAFPDDADPITIKNIGEAVGAFERKLMTPSRFDDFMGGKHDALSEQELAGLEAFKAVNCVMCHTSTLLGGQMNQKLGLVKAWETKDPGVAKETKAEGDRFFFKVPTLRNVTKTGPFLHDGSMTDLGEVVSLMADRQLGRTLTDKEKADIVAFLGALEGRTDHLTALITKPELPPNGPNTPVPDSN